MPKLGLGLTWQKLDLHVHTPASHDYVGPEVGPREFLETVRSNGVDGIAVTDHNTGEWIDKLKAVADDVGVAVLPGVELSVTGGKNGSVHLLALFDRSATTRTVENLLAQLGLNEGEYGRPEAVSAKSPEEAVQIIARLGGLPLLAHADSTKGVLHDMSGQPRIRVMNRPELVGAEVKDVPKYRAMLDGSDPQYQRPVAVFRGSDNRSQADDGHNVSAVGTRFTHFKVDGLSLESLRQCFSDPDVRIRTDVDLEAQPESDDFPRIEAVEVSQGFLKGRFELHKGLNCVVGGKGVGKSLLIELIRFGLRQPPSLDIIREDHDSKLKSRLGVGGSVQLYVRTSAGRRLTIRRDYDGDQNRTSIRDSESDEEVDAAIDELFPILAYSQTEAIEIARSRGAQLALIDSMLPLGPLQRTAREVRAQLSISGREIASALAAKEELAQLRADAATVEEQTKEIEKLLESDEYRQWRSTVPKSEAFSQVTRVAEELNEELDTASEAVDALVVPEFDADLKNDSDLQATAGALRTALESVKGSLSQALEAAKSAARTANEASAEWGTTAGRARSTYQEWAKKAGGNRSELVARLRVR